ncbi:MAG: flavin reductase family protein [Defluviitaleaceae bacterium]|nr:flavin reductase family protein [Defluviitaleaceae bacterium]
MADFTLALEKGMREFSTHGGFLSVRGPSGPNAMTVSWGFVGFMWNKPQFITVVRPQRYTNELLVAGADSFTVSVPFGGALREELNVCGTESGRSIDKSKIVKFERAKSVECPIVGGCSLYYECKINLAQQMEATLLKQSIVKQFYQNDFHFMYIGEIVECYER